MTSSFQFDTAAGEQAKIEAALTTHSATQSHGPGTSGTAQDMGYAVLGDPAYGAITPGYDLGYNILPALHAALATGRPVWVPPGLWDTAAYAGNTTGQIMINRDDVAIHLAKGAFIRDTTTPSFPTVAWFSSFISHGTAKRTSKVNRLSITGQGEFVTKLGAQRTKICVWGDDIVFADFTIRDWDNGLAFQGGGNRMRGYNVRAIRNSSFSGSNGGWRYSTGDDSTFTGLHVESGDDALQAVPMQASFAHPWVNTSIRRLTYVGCTGKSGARFIAVVNSDKTYSPWAPATVYAAAAKVSVLQGDGTALGYTANSAHTSGATFTTAGWTLVGVVGMTSDIDATFVSCKGFGGQRSVAIRNEGPSKGWIKASLIDCEVDASLAVLESTSGDMVITRESQTGEVDATITNSPIINPRAVSLKTDGEVNVNINGGKWVANPGASKTLDLTGSVTVDKITTVGCGFNNVIAAGIGVAQTNLRVSDSDFLDIPSDLVRSVINLQNAQGARITNNRPVGGTATTKFVLYNALSTDTMSTGNDLTEFAGTTPWSTPLPSNTVNVNNPGYLSASGPNTVVPEVEFTNTAAGSTEILSGLPYTIHNLTLTANAGCVGTLPAPFIGAITVKSYNTSTTQTRSITWSAPTGSSLIWLPSGAATQTVGIGKAQVAVFRCFSGTIWYGKVTDGDFTP